MSHVHDDRYAIERAKWDAHASTASEPIAPLPPGADFDSYARRDPLLPGVAEFLGDLRGKRVVEYGCGMGKLTVLLARSGALVSAFDLSEASVDVARRRAHESGLDGQIEFAIAPGARGQGVGGRIFWVIDQIDSLVGMLLFIAPIWTPSLTMLAAIVAIMLVAHPVSAWIMMWFGLKDRVG